MQRETEMIVTMRNDPDDPGGSRVWNTGESLFYPQAYAPNIPMFQLVASSTHGGTECCFIWLFTSPLIGRSRGQERKQEVIVLELFILAFLFGGCS